MADRYHGGCGELYPAADLALVLAGYPGVTSATAAGITIGTPGRFGGSYINLSNANFEPVFDAQNTWIVGRAWYHEANPGSTQIITRIKDGSSTQVDLRITSTGTLEITRDGTVLATSVLTLTPAVWYYIQFKAVIHNSTGSVEVKVGATSYASASNVDTQATANATADRIRIEGTVNGPTNRVDDLFIFDGTGPANNNFISGEARIDTQRPDTEGNQNDFTPSTGTDNSDLVDEATPNGDTDYVESSTVGHIDLYTYTDSALSGTVAALSIVNYARKTDAGTREIRVKTRRAGVNYNGATKTLQSTYTYPTELQEVDPSTGAAWTIANFNGAELGAEVVT